MRNILFFSLLTILCIILASCNVKKDFEQSDSTEKADNSHEAKVTTEATESYVIIGPPSKESIVFISSYDSYFEHIKSSDIPESFVRFEKDSIFGEFHSFTTLRQNKYRQYTYSFTDENGCEILLYIEHGKTLDESITDNAITTAKVDINRHDMRGIDDNEHVYQLRVDGLMYGYVKGMLNYIGWEHDNALYTLTVRQGIENYPLDENITAVSKLLNTETAPQVVEKILEAINSANK